MNGSRAMGINGNAAAGREEEGFLATHARRLFDVVTARPFLFYIGFVLAASAFYFLVLAAPIYSSEAKFVVRGKQPVQSSPLLAVLSGTQAGLPESAALSDYIQSSDLLAQLDRELGLRRLYSAYRPDFFYRMGPNVSQRRFANFYRDMVSVDLDSTSNILTLRVKSFDPDSAHATAKRILAHSAGFVADLSRQMLDESTRAAQRDFDIAQQEAINARLAVSSFQSRSGNLDPAAYGAAANSAMFSLQAEIARLRAQLASLRTYSTARSPQVLQIQAQIANLEQQVANTKQQLVGRGRDTIAGQLNSYQGLVIRQTYADQRLVAAQAALDQAKSAAAQRQLFVVPVAGPTRPDEATPRAIWGMATVLVIALCIYAIGMFVLASIRDHRM